MDNKSKAAEVNPAEPANWQLLQTVKNRDCFFLLLKLQFSLSWPQTLRRWKVIQCHSANMHSFCRILLFATGSLLTEEDKHLFELFSSSNFTFICWSYKCYRKSGNTQVAYRPAAATHAHCFQPPDIWKWLQPSAHPPPLTDVYKTGRGANNSKQRLFLEEDVCR